MNPPLGFDVMRAVYCYCFPETRRVLRDVEERLPDELFRVTALATDLQPSIDAIIQPQLVLPAMPDGRISLDELHTPIIERIIGAYQETVPGLATFPHRYVTNGSSEGIFHLLAGLRSKGVDRIHVLDGEYEGYAAQAHNLGMGVETHRLEGLDPRRIDPGHWFLSNPSAREGDILPDGVLQSLCDAGHSVIPDLAYAGATAPHRFGIDHENVPAAVMSFSKPYGVFRFRLGGFCFSKAEVPSLYGNKWFKDVVRLVQALALAERIGPSTLHGKYHMTQQRIVEEINRDTGVGMEPSDALLLAHLSAAQAAALTPEQQSLIAPFRRGDGYRFCLTPRFERYEGLFQDPAEGHGRAGGG
jgi:hypothetical protein